MDQKQWYYSLEGEEKGPFTPHEIKEKVEKGELHENILVWSSVSSEKKPISEVEGFHLTRTYDEPIVESLHGEAPEISIKGTRVVHPWIRFWARFIDYFLLAFATGIVLGFFHLPPHIYTGPFLGIFLIFLWVFIEAILLSTWGWTPGKWWLRVKVRREDESKMPFSDSLNRAFSVWWLGMAAGTIIAIVTWIVAAVKLSNNRITTWDRRGKLLVEHEKIGWFRILSAIIFYVVIISLVLKGHFYH